MRNIGQQQINELKDVIVILQQIDSQVFFEEIASIQKKISEQAVSDNYLKCPECGYNSFFIEDVGQCRGFLFYFKCTKCGHEKRRKINP